MKDAKTHVVIFDKPYPPDKIREGIGVNHAFATGACDRCPHLPECESDESFRFPDDAACMIHAASLQR